MAQSKQLQNESWNFLNVIIKAVDSKFNKSDKALLEQIAGTLHKNNMQYVHDPELSRTIKRRTVLQHGLEKQQRNQTEEDNAHKKL
ncbi:MAG: hypothetical protein AB8B67_02855 [Rickettsiaceae bacterium]